jgi:histone H3/H4
MSAAAKDILEMMNAWNKIQAAAREQFPNASEEEIYQITKDAMRHALKAS